MSTSSFSTQLSETNEELEKSEAPDDLTENLPGESKSHLVASEQILTDFPICPPEVRNMIYAAMVNKPRLLSMAACSWKFYVKGMENQLGRAAKRRPCPFDSRIPNIKSRSESMYFKHAGLPTSLFLNKEAHAETMRRIRVVQEADELNVDKYPFSYINPKYDVLYADSFLFFPTAKQTPDLQTFAIPIDEYYWCLSIPFFWEAAVIEFHRLPSLKELLIVRDIRMIKKFGDKPYDKTHKWKVAPPKDTPGTVTIQRHPCGFFGLLHDDIEKTIIQVDRKSYMFHKVSQEFLDLFRKEVAAINERLHPGTKLPKITAVYNQWVDDHGVWQDIDSSSG